MSEYYKSTNDVAVTIYGEVPDPWAEVRAYKFPDGSWVNRLDADELEAVIQDE